MHMHLHIHMPQARHGLRAWPLVDLDGGGGRLAQRGDVLGERLRRRAAHKAALRRDIAEALAAEPFDKARFEALLAEHRGRLDRFQQGLQAGLLAAAETMTPEQRKEYAERMLRHGRRDKGR